MKGRRDILLPRRRSLMAIPLCRSVICVRVLMWRFARCRGSSWYRQWLLVQVLLAHDSRPLSGYRGWKSRFTCRSRWSAFPLLNHSPCRPLSSVELRGGPPCCRRRTLSCVEVIGRSRSWSGRWYRYSSYVCRCYRLLRNSQRRRGSRTSDGPRERPRRRGRYLSLLLKDARPIFHRASSFQPHTTPARNPPIRRTSCRFSLEHLGHRLQDPLLKLSRAAQVGRGHRSSTAGRGIG